MPICETIKNYMFIQNFSLIYNYMAYLGFQDMTLDEN